MLRPGVNICVRRSHDIDIARDAAALALSTVRLTGKPGGRLRRPHFPEDDVSRLWQHPAASRIRRSVSDVHRKAYSVRSPARGVDASSLNPMQPHRQAFSQLPSQALQGATNGRSFFAGRQCSGLGLSFIQDALSGDVSSVGFDLKKLSSLKPRIIATGLAIWCFCAKRERGYKPQKS
jgi:hypothetical protein